LDYSRRKSDRPVAPPECDNIPFTFSTPLSYNIPRAPVGRSRRYFTEPFEVKYRSFSKYSIGGLLMFSSGMVRLRKIPKINKTNHTHLRLIKICQNKSNQKTNQNHSDVKMNKKRNSLKNSNYFSRYGKYTPFLASSPGIY
jgi:hypothetical protein